MPRPALRSRSLRKVKKRLPGGRLTTHYEKRKPSAPKCGKCKKPLHGLPRERQIKLSSMSSSKRRVSRPYGGNLCSSCMRSEIRSRILKVV